jgi:hypothetical protein
MADVSDEIYTGLDTTSLPQLGQLGQSRIHAAAAVEQAIDFVHDLSQGPQLR